MFSFKLAHKKKTDSKDKQDREKIDEANEKDGVSKEAFRNDVNEHIGGRIQHP